MSNQRYLYCRDCNAVHHVTPFDTAPEFAVNGVEIQEIPQDDRREFVDRHAGHRIGDLIGVDESREEAQIQGDPMTVRFIEVTDGREFFVLRASRKSIADPLTYEVLPRQLRLWDVLDGVGSTPKNSPPRRPQRRRKRATGPAPADLRPTEFPGVPGTP
jgi:hypothetical protein